MARKKYSIFDFYNISKQGVGIELDDMTIKVINSLSQRVGAPTYQKTPIFKKRERKVKQEITDNEKESKSIKSARVVVEAQGGC